MWFIQGCLTQGPVQFMSSLLDSISMGGNAQCLEQSTSPHCPRLNGSRILVADFRAATALKEEDEHVVYLT